MAKIDLSVRYSNLLDTKLQDVLVLKDGVIFNNRYEGSAKAGAVKVRKTGASTVADYDVDNGVALTKGSSEWITVTIDKDKAVNEIIDGYEADAVPDGMVADRLNEAAKGLALQIEKDAAAELISGGTQLNSTTALTKSTVYNAIVDVRATMTRAGVPNDGRRFLIVAPEVYSLLLQADEFIKGSDLGDAIIATGAVGKIAGFLVFECANLGDDVEFVAGHPDYVTRVTEWQSMPHVVSLEGSGTYIGASAVKGRKIYAHKVTNEDAVYIKATKTLNP